MIHYKPVKIIINAPVLTEIIIDVIVCHHCLSDSIDTNRGSLFTLKLWLLLCNFFSIKRWLLIAFYLQTDGKTKRQNNTLKTYFQVFVNVEQNNWAKLLPIAKFAYNNAKNSNIGYISFKLNRGYPLCIFLKENTNFSSQSKSAN